MIYLAEHLKKNMHIDPLVLMGSEIPFPFPLKPSQIITTLVPNDVIASMPLLEDWAICSRLASNSGYAGCYHGFVTDLARFAINASASSKNDIELFACGPTAMLEVVQLLAAQYELPCQISLEEHMACAVGGCAGCAVEIDTTAGRSMKRVCVDGPVFEASTVVFSET
jgi:dihydroorotate dehydrogenase electron transfer subunit